MTKIEANIVEILQQFTMNPRWLKVKAAALYSGIGQQRLKSLALTGDIRGYQDQESGRKDWIFDKTSIDEYRLKPLHENNIRLNRLLDEVGR